MNSFEKNISLIGMPGCGKTTIGKMLAQRLGVDFYDSDNYIEKITGKSISRIFQNGEDYFRQLETESIKELSLKSHIVMATGGGVVKRIENIEALKNNGIIIFINRPLENIAEDINTEERPLLKDKKENLYRLYDERIELYKKYCDYELMNDKTIDCAVNDIILIIDYHSRLSR
ncbi:shikimate kinase [Proteiniborus sp. MB09-C3]|uniref:shikimate kinase n=1 Tax=Proteiniborus sp. MB09-C3 TaxID=3050072 RepID=UPI002552C7E7|nr:shikimate kinase [Proteiniborus sp. MB09-C3]WIV11299.1 shikimate kinase [Proteiniborus sp. MB09-C3]